MGTLNLSVNAFIIIIFSSAQEMKYFWTEMQFKYVSEIRVWHDLKYQYL